MRQETSDILRGPYAAGDVDHLPRYYHKGKPDERVIQLDYVGHAAVTARLLDADIGWMWEPFATDEQGLPRIIRRGDCWELWIRLTVDGTTRPAVGTVPVEQDREGNELPPDQDTAKELIGDAIRNGAMRFGVALDLWRKHAQSGTSTPAADGPPCPHCGTPVTFASEDERTARTKPGRKAPPIWSCSNRDCGGGGPRDKNDPAKGNWPWGSYEADFFDKQTLVVSRGTGTKPEVPADAWPVDPLPPTGQTPEQAREEAEAHVNCGVDGRTVDSIAHSMTELFRLMSAAGLWPADAYRQALAAAHVADPHKFGKKPDLLRWAESLYGKAAAKLGEG